MPEQHGDKSLEATPHRRQQARDEGQVARSHDLAQAAVLLTGVAAIMFLGGGLAAFLADFTRQHLGGDAWLAADAGFLQGRWWSTVSGLGRVLLPILVLLLAAAVALSLLQTGFLFLPARLAPDASRIDPLKGLARIFSLTNVVRLAFGIFKIAVISGVAYASLYQEMDAVLGLAGLSLPQIAAYLAEILLWTSLKIAGALVVLAILDYAFQWWKHEQDLRMTPQEVREEMRNLQGDPQIIARRRAVQRQLVLNRLSKSVPKANVVITNPTELAVAIQYDPETMNAPIVVAKGAGVVAQRIRRLALDHGIPLVEKKPLAQALYRDVDVNHPIPSQLYAAVAEVLAYVYQLQGKRLPARAGV